MRIRADLQDKLCRTFCKYYKPSKKEELACGGFLVIENLLREGRKVPFDTFIERMNPVTRDLLVQNLCVLCAFYEADCDFVQQLESPPCGGFLLLCRLLEAEVISIDNIRCVS